MNWHVQWRREVIAARPRIRTTWSHDHRSFGYPGVASGSDGRNWDEIPEKYVETARS